MNSSEEVVDIINEAIEVLNATDVWSLTLIDIEDVKDIRDQLDQVRIYLRSNETIDDLLQDFPSFVQLLDECLDENERLLTDVTEIILSLAVAGGLGALIIALITIGNYLIIMLNNK